MRAYEIVSDGGVDALALSSRHTPTPGAGEILLRMRASAINYRDLSTIEEPTARGSISPYPQFGWRGRGDRRWCRR